MPENVKINRYLYEYSQLLFSKLVFRYNICLNKRMIKYARYQQRNINFCSKWDHFKF